MELDGEPQGYRIITKISHLRRIRREDLLNGKSVGFVPTMGALHEGHLALVRQAARENHRVYVSIYVNPTQFGMSEDLTLYPRPWEIDQAKLMQLVDEFRPDEKMGDIAVVFTPSTEEMYPGLPPTSEVNGDGSFVTITPLSSILEGASRPVFFRGVATVCMKLLNLVQPERVYFGEKDIQQTLVIRQMVRDFHLDTEVCTYPTVREADGLAMSSRNVYLGKRRRAVAIVLFNALEAARQAYAKGKRKRTELLGEATDVISHVQEQQRDLPPCKRAMFEVDYISLADHMTMEEINEVSAVRGAILSGAIRMLPVEEPQEGEDIGFGGGSSVVRLIDNLSLPVLTVTNERPVAN